MTTSNPLTDLPDCSDLFTPAQPPKDNSAEAEEVTGKLRAFFGQWKIRYHDITCIPGRRISQYLISPDQVTSQRKLLKLDIDLSLALERYGVAVFPAPNEKEAFGTVILVPNKNASIPVFSEVFASDAMQKSEAVLPAAFGEDIDGNPLVCDLTRLPHLLIAGTTGSGKSVFLHGMLVSLLLKKRPEDVRLLLIDLKSVEFTSYRGLPHLWMPIVNDPKRCVAALQTAVEEMERRFELLGQAGVTDIGKYNELAGKEKLPYIVTVIDELADPIMCARKPIEEAILRLTQKGRAVGIHLVIATQRPTVDVLTGTIKANIPSRIAFSVLSSIDSKIILDVSGAEKLIGRGDMLFSPIGSIRPIRAQACLIYDRETEAVCSRLRDTLGEAVYDPAILQRIDELIDTYIEKEEKKRKRSRSGEDSGQEDDRIYAEAVLLCMRENRVSSAMLQRELNLGYTRAAGLIERMIADGFVFRPKPELKVTVTPEKFAERFPAFAEAENGAVPEFLSREDDPEYIEALRIVIEETRVSTSLLQRKLKIGYTRAVKLIERMEADGFIPAGDGTIRPRVPLLTREEFFKRFLPGIPSDTDEKN